MAKVNSHAKEAAPAIQVRGLRKEYSKGEIGLEKVDLSINSGELVVLLGPSGSGKTSLLRTIAGLEEITEGEVLFGEEVINNTPPDERNVSMVFQDLALYPHMKVRDNIAFPLRAKRGQSKEMVTKLVEEKSGLLGIEYLLDRGLNQLSGGERQRVALARALVREPFVYLLDEPFSSLDAMLRREFRAELKRFQRQVGTTILFVTHDQEDAMTMADRIALFRKGRIVQFDTPRSLFDEPVNLFAATFVGSPPINTVVGAIERRGSSRVFVAEGLKIPIPDAPDTLADGRDITLGVRPQSVRWIDSPRTGEPAAPATVDVIEPIGTQAIAHFNGPLGEWSGVFEADEVPSEGQRGHLVFSGDKIHLFDGTTEDSPRVTYENPSRAKQETREDNG